MAMTEMNYVSGGGGVNLQSGEFTKTIATGGSYVSENITFTTPFSTVPKVYVRATRNTRDYGDAGNTYVTANPISVTTSGFTMSCTESETNNVTINVEWVAFTD